MTLNNQKYVYNNFVDFFFIKFPFIFPIFYVFILYTFPELENYLILTTIILLAEPHFGATWAIFFDKRNYEYHINKAKLYYGGSLIIILFSVLGFFYFQGLFFLVFYGFNIYHVTKQSLGIVKLYNLDNKEKKYQIFFIYNLNFLFFLIGLFRFYIPIINEDNLFFLNLIIISCIILIFLYQLKRYNSIQNSFTTLTGMIIFMPILFVEKPIHAILLGVTMHYSQYIFISAKVFAGRRKNKLFGSKFLLYILFYGLIMGFLTSQNHIGDDFSKNLILIPLIGQMLHFYLDGFLWKFSEKHNRENTLRYIFQKN